LVPAEAAAVRELGSAGPEPESALIAIPLQGMMVAATGSALNIPEVVLAAYRNAELALAAANPGCGLSWSLLAGIGRIESGHASGGRTDTAGTTATPILGPALDGHLPGNAVIPAPGNGFVRAVGPMQFLPGTWRFYAADGNADGATDPNNVFDASLAAGKYLCSGGLDLRDPAQELRAVLRYNNSMAYAENVLSWAQAYRTGGTPSAVALSPDLIPPSSDVSRTAKPGGAGPANKTAPAPQQVLPAQPPTITIPGLPPIPCGIFCPPIPAAPLPAGPGPLVPAPLVMAPVTPPVTPR
jgi:hypothetical protein